MIAGVVYYLKKVAGVEDFITKESKLIMIAPFIMLATILIAYFFYDRLAKKSKSIDDEDKNREEQLKLFQNASIIKIAMFEFVGTFASVMLLLYYNTNYLYMIGIVIIFYLVSFPNQIKFRRDFIKDKEFFD